MDGEGSDYEEGRTGTIKGFEQLQRKDCLYLLRKLDYEILRPLFIYNYERDKMKKEELNEYGYPIHPKSDYSKPPEGNFGMWVGLILVFSLMSLGMLKLSGMG